MKYAGIILTALTPIMLSCYVSKRMRLRVRSLERIAAMIDTISAKLEYSMMPTVDLLAALAENPEFRELDFLRLCCERCKLGESFPKAWKSSVTERATEYALTQNDAELLTVLGEILGSVDAEGQINRLRSYRASVSSELEKAEKSFEKYGKNMPVIGALCSITVGIVLI